jgi:hypothetical protein
MMKHTRPEIIIIIIVVVVVVVVVVIIIIIIIIITISKMISELSCFEFTQGFNGWRTNGLHAV